MQKVWDEPSKEQIISYNKEEKIIVEKTEHALSELKKLRESLIKEIQWIARAK